jgi:hypothetical protein
MTRRLRETIFETPRRAWLIRDDGIERGFQEVDIIGETERQYRIWAKTRTRLAGRARELKPGDRALVPKEAIRWTAPPRRSPPGARKDL